jgi:flagellar hook-length control protein FliK
MPSPFITTTPKGSDGSVLAALQTPRQAQPGRSEDFSSVFEQRMREQEASPSRTTPQAPARREETAPERHGQNASGSVENSEPAGRHSRAEKDTAESTTQSQESNTPVAGQQVTDVATANTTGQAPQAEAAPPASLAAVASIIAAIDRSLPTGNTGLDLDIEIEIDDAALDTLGRRARGFVFSNPSGNGAKAGGPSVSTPLTNGVEATFAPQGGQSKNAAAALPTTTVAAQIQLAASHAGRFGAAVATSLQPAIAESPVAGLSSTGLFAAQRGDPGPIPQLQVHTPAGQRAWAEDIGSRMLWMVGRGESRAELVLTPPSLGKLGVSIQVNGDQTSAHFVAATAAAREALEQAMPRLREALQQAGITLGQTNVSTSGEQQAREDRHDEQAGNGVRIGHPLLDVDAPLSPLPAQRWASTGTGMIDTFA